MARRRFIVVGIAAVVAIGIGLAMPRAIAAAHHRHDTAWVAAPLPAPAPASAPGTNQDTGAVSSDTGAKVVTVDFTGDFLGWAKQDRKTLEIVGANLDETSSTESMVKTWLVADFLRRSIAEKGEKPGAGDMTAAREAIRWSDDNAAQVLYETNGGNASIERMIKMCGLTDTAVYDDWWSRTQMSPLDAIRLGECVIEGTAAGPVWTGWLLNEMRSVEGSTDKADQELTRGGGRWGIIDGVPAAQASTVAIKNGWTSIKTDGNWHVNCLAITQDWTMSVMMRYPADLGLDYGAGVCESVARQLLT